MMHLTGDLILRSDCGVPTEIPIRIEFPVNYPNREPTAYDAASRFPTNLDRHILRDGQFCLWLPPCSPWSPTDPRRLLRFLDEVAVFLDRQLVYDITGGREWPGPQYGHGTTGYEEFMLSVLGDNEAHLRVLLPVILGREALEPYEACPCDSQKKYKWCHAKTVEDIIQRIGRNRLDRLYRSRIPADDLNHGKTRNLLEGSQ
jgi:hypothetical protein